MVLVVVKGKARVLLSGNRHEYILVGCPPPSMTPEHVT